MKTDKISLMGALALGGLLAVTSIASAQEAKEGSKGERRGGSIQQRVDRVSTELKLNDEQKTKVTTLFESQGKKRQELRTLAPDERREKARALMEEQTKKMKEILTPDQFEKWQKLRPQGRARRGGAAEENKTDKKQ